MKNLTKITLITLISLISGSDSFGQQSKTDSLLKALKTAKADTTKIKTLNRLSSALSRTGEYKKALHYANKALTEIQNTNNKIQITNEKKGWLKKAKATAYNNIAVIFRLQGNYPKALDYHTRSLKFSRQLNDKAGIARTYNNIAIIYYEQGNYPKALDHHRRSLKLKRQLNDKAGIARTYTNIGTLYTTLPDSVPGISRDSTERLYERAMELQQKSLQITKEIGAAELMTHALNGIGALYLKFGNWEIGKLGNWEKAVKYYEQSAQIADSIGAKPQMVAAYEGLAEAYAKLGGSTSPLTPLLKERGTRAEYFEKAYQYHVKYSKVKEEIFNEKKSKELGRQEMAHEYELEQIERKQREEAAVKAKASLHLRYYWVIIAFLVACGLGSMFSGWFAIREKTAKSLIFVAVVFLFEFILVLTDPLIDQYMGGNPALTLATNSSIALLMIPVHNFLVNKLVGRVTKVSVGRRKVRRKQLTVDN